MSSDFLSVFSELENKIEILLQSLEEARDENAILRQSSSLNDSRVSELESRGKELEGENGSLKKQVEALTADLNDQRGKVTAAAERVQAMLAKLKEER